MKRAYKNILKSMIAILAIIGITHFETLNSEGEDLEDIDDSRTMHQEQENQYLSSEPRVLVNTSKMIVGSGFSEAYQVIMFASDIENNYTVLSWKADSNPIDDTDSEFNFNNNLVIYSDNIASILPTLSKIRNNLYDTNVSYSALEESVMYKETYNSDLDMTSLTQAELNYYIDYMTSRICYDIILEEQYNADGDYTYVDDTIDTTNIIADFTSYLTHISKLEGFNN
jgi:hypothetical protein